MILIWLVPTFMVGDVHCSVDLSVVDHIVYFENKKSHQFKIYLKTYLINVTFMYILLDKSVPWIYLMAYYYGFNDELINDKNTRSHESYVITCTS